MNKAAEYLKEKYAKYISNLEWHLANNPPQADHQKEKMRLECYKEMLRDLEEFFPSNS